MKKNVIFFLLFLILAAANLQSETISIAITGIEALGVNEETARMIEDILQTEFSRMPLFQVVERTGLNNLVQEQKLQISGITSAQSAAQTGNILNVQKVVFGSISRYESEYVKYLVSLRLVDVERAAVEAAETVEIRNDEEILDKIYMLAVQLSDQVKIIGKITLLEENIVYTSLGVDSGILPGEILSVSTVELIKDEQGQVVMREENDIANLVIEDISKEGSRCRVLESNNNLAPGMTVRIGKIDIETESDKSSLEVKSVPENSRVYLDSTFLGITPLRMTGIEPGTYKLEIRSGEGYKPYTGRLTLKPGKNITIERELDPESPSLEDIMMLGKVPRRPTDPGEALKKSLIPGAGFVYNGYPEMAGIVSAPLPVGVVELIMLYTSGFMDSSGGVVPNISFYTNFYAIGITATCLFPYITSLFDAHGSAVEEFLYPMYSEMTTGGCIQFLQRSDLYEIGYPDITLMNKAIEGIKTGYWGMDISYLLNSRSYLINYGLQTYLPISESYSPVFSIYMGFYYKPWIIEKLAFGFGLRAVTNMVFHSDNSVVSPTMMDVFPAFLISYISQELEIDLITTGLSFYYADTYSQFHPTLLAGPRARLDLRYFFGLRTGIRLTGEYQHMWNIDQEQKASGLGVVNTYQMLNASAGFVYRY